jgi:Skp family chaperone for outer membrane proteins
MGSTALTACSDLDSALFGDEGGASASDAAFPAADAGAPPSAGTTSASVPMPPPPVAATPSGAAPIATITPVVVVGGSDTGTQVNRTIQSIRAQVAGLQQKIATNAARLADLRNQGAGAANAYQNSKARITARLQIGTTRGNPELVAEWNSAQSSLDSLSANINALNALGTDVNNDSSGAHFALNQISATMNVSGAVDEDHRQLTLLEDETSQTIVVLDRLLSEISQNVQRQTAYAANERANLTVLANSIKSGELYGALATPVPSGALSSQQLASAGSPLVVIKFDRPDVDYQQQLYAALNQALQSRPSAGFEVVAVSPSKGNAASVQIAQTTARRNAQDVMRSMTDMGVPATRLGVASTTDPGAAGSEVRVFVR